MEQPCGARERGRSVGTITSITPFIGLFGTVSGIMISFKQIGAAGSSSLAVVAPGVAGALLLTGAGLLAAMAAVYYCSRITRRA